MKKILITGATGFIGKQVLQNLLAKGVTLKVVVRNLKKRLSEDNHGGIQYIQSNDLYFI
jgi:uncharacterized protein YbjT (DUF2867 family)